MASKLVYVVVLNWNGWQDTIQCIKSVSSSIYKDFQLIVVDNASTDESVPHIRQCYPEVFMLESRENKGYSGGNNIGIRYALEQGAEYVWVLNNDTIVSPDCLGSMIEMAESDPSIGAVGSVILDQNEPRSVQAWGGGNVSFILGRSAHATFKCEVDYITGASILIKKYAFQEVGFFDEESFFMYWEDADFSFRLKEAGWKVKVANGAVVYHKMSASIGAGSPKMIEYFNSSAVRFFRKHAKFPILPIFIGGLSRIAKQLLRGNISKAKMVYLGMKQGM